MGVQQSSATGFDHLLHSITINSGHYLADDDDADSDNDNVEKLKLSSSSTASNNSTSVIPTIRQTRSLFNARLNRLNSSISSSNNNNNNNNNNKPTTRSNSKIPSESSTPDVSALPSAMPLIPPSMSSSLSGVGVGGVGMVPSSSPLSGGQQQQLLLVNREAMERVRDKLINASSVWLSSSSNNHRNSNENGYYGSGGHENQNFRILNGSGTTSILHHRRRAASSPEEREKLIMTLAMYLSHKEEMLSSYLASDWMSSVRIIEKMLIPNEYTQFIELAVQVIDENFELASEDSEESQKKKQKKQPHTRNRSGGILSSVSHHHHHRRQAVPKNQNLTPSAAQTLLADQPPQYVNIKLMIIPQKLKYSTLVEACFPVLESFLIDPMDGIADNFAVSLVVDNWFLYFEPDTNLIIPKKLYCTAKTFVDEQIPIFVRVQHKSNQIQSLLASCVSKWNNSKYFKASKIDDNIINFHQQQENVEPSFEDSTMSSVGRSSSGGSSSNQKYYGNSFDFIEDFFVNYLKFDFINTPTAKYLQSFLENVQKFGFSELMFNASDDLMCKYGEELRMAKDGKMSFLDCGELEFFMDRLSLAIQENEPIFDTLPSDCLENNPFVALNILNGAMNMQFIEEDEYEL